VLGLIAQETAQRQPAEKVLAAFGDPVFRSNYLAKTQKDAPEQLAVKQSLDNERFYQTLRDVESDDYNPDQLRGLFYAGRELANLRALAPDALIAGEFDATRDALQQTDLRQYRVLHFATHGLLNEKRPENSGLVMSLVNREGQAREGFVSLSDIYNLRAPADLVVLSACRTALGKDVRGEGLIGLTRGFMYAGASSVAASLWKVDDEATAELMKLFYTNMLQKEMPPPAALRAAQNEIRQRPEWSAPYYWAAFTLQGEYRQVIKPANSWSRNAKAAAGLGALLMILAGAAWLLRRRRISIRK
jgi:CHAT domain-containing protein